MPIYYYPGLLYKEIHQERLHNISKKKIILDLLVSFAAKLPKTRIYSECFTQFLPFMLL